MGRSIAVSLSLATLWFIGIWSDLLPFLYISDRFPIGALPCWNDFLAVALNVAALAAFFALAAFVHERLTGRAAALGAVAVTVRWRPRVVRVVVSALAILFPLVPITVAQAGWAISQAGGRMQCSAG